MSTSEHQDCSSFQTPAASALIPAAEDSNAVAPHEGPAPLPTAPRPSAVSLAHLLKRIERMDRALVVLVVALAALLAFFPIRNSDIFQHLATGRLLVQGQYHFGADPFTHSSAPVPAPYPDRRRGRLGQPLVVSGLHSLSLLPRRARRQIVRCAEVAAGCRPGGLDAPGGSQGWAASLDSCVVHCFGSDRS